MLNHKYFKIFFDFGLTSDLQLNLIPAILKYVEEFLQKGLFKNLTKIYDYLNGINLLV